MLIVIVFLVLFFPLREAKARLELKIYEDEHLKIVKMIKDSELDESSVVEDSSVTASDGKNYKTKIYNLDAIIAVGYRVNSKKATEFRIWATKILRDYMTKGFVLNDERFIRGNKYDAKYFDELLERIKKIRVSERMSYQNNRSIYCYIN